ncbi:nitrite reductase small subunit NirD [uncultured Shimia sp.]|uniref:nitrite reductase small subunit NirD n=1 Tax=uncultured Shimia sp. TaxID=573152 RepID=UPI002635C881|nr:nitrite reductase small subunit NirD [uncultured Shimia sp.]
MNWIDICSITDIPLRGARIVKTAVGCVAVFRTDDSEVFATSDRCPHKGGPLSEGIVHGKAVTCPLHNWVFSLETGEAQGADEGQIATFATQIEDGRVMLDVTELTPGVAAE